MQLLEDIERILKQQNSQAHKTVCYVCSTTSACYESIFSMQHKFNRETCVCKYEPERSGSAQCSRFQMSKRKISGLLSTMRLPHESTNHGASPGTFLSGKVLLFVAVTGQSLNLVFHLINSTGKMRRLSSQYLFHEVCFTTYDGKYLLTAFYNSQHRNINKACSLYNSKVRKVQYAFTRKSHSNLTAACFVSLAVLCRKTKRNLNGLYGSI